MIIKFKERYNSMSLPLKMGLWFTLCQFIQKGISMISTPIFTRMLSTTEYGRASAFMSWTDIIMPLMTLSVWRAMMNLFAKDKDKNLVLSNVVTLSLVISMLWGILALIFSEFVIRFTGLPFLLCVCLFIYCFSQNIYYAWTTKLQYEYKYKPLIIASLLYTSFTSFGGVVSVLLLSRSAEGKVIPQVICLFIIAVLIIIGSLNKNKNSFDKSICVFSLCFAVPLIPHYLSEVVLHSSDRIMIDQLCSSADVAVYSVAYSVGGLINLVANTVNTAFVPYQYQKIKSKEYKLLAKNTNIIMVCLAVCLCMLMLFGSEIIYIFGGRAYLEGAALVIPISLGVYFNYMFQLFARVQEYFEQKHTIVIASITCAILNVVLNYVFIPMYGYQAAAYTTFICYLLFCVIHYFFYKVACKKNIYVEIYDVKGLIAVSVFLVAVSFFIKIIAKYIIAKYIVLSVVIVLIVLCRKRIVDFLVKMKKGDK